MRCATNYTAKKKDRKCGYFRILLGYEIFLNIINIINILRRLANIAQDRGNSDTSDSPAHSSTNLRVIQNVPPLEGMYLKFKYIIFIYYINI